MKLQMNTESLGCIFNKLGQYTHTPLQQEEYSQTYAIPSQYGTGHIERVRLREGIEVNWFDAKFHEPVSLDVDVQYPHLEISYMTSGQGGWETTEQSKSYGLSPGMSTLVFLRNEKLYAELSPRVGIAHMEIRIDIRRLGMLLPELARLSSHSFYCRQEAGVPQIPLIVEQMKQCPYSGALQKLYLEGKVFELLAFHLDRAEKQEGRSLQQSKLKADDINSLHNAKDILTRTWKQPPSLLELARLVGLNDYKLKLGFKELFGTTVFGYVRGLRMNEARSILEQGKANVSEAAGMVGYHNLSHFALMFRKTYGYNPSEFGKIHLAGANPAALPNDPFDV